MLPAALSYPATANGVILSGRGLFRGVTFAETAGAAASVAVYDAAKIGDVTKPLIPVCTLAASAFAALPFGASPAAVERGIVVAVTGAVTVVVFANPETRLLHELAMFDDGTSDLTDYALYRRALEVGALT